MASELTRERLAAAITRVREAHAVSLAKYATTADELAGELLAELATADDPRDEASDGE